MPAESAPHPPTSGRLAAAARRGLFPRSDLIGAGASFAALGVVLALTGPALLETAANRLRNGLEAALGSPDPSRAIHDIAVGVVLLAGPPLGVSFAIACVVGLRNQRRAGVTAAALPAAPQSRGLRVGIRAFALAICAAVWVAAWRHSRGSMLLLDLDPEQWPAAISWIPRGLVSTGLILIAAGIIELLAQRAALWKALHLDSLEQRREMRMLAGDSQIKGRRHAPQERTSKK